MIIQEINNKQCLLNSILVLVVLCISIYLYYSRTETFVDYLLALVLSSVRLCTGPHLTEKNTFKLAVNIYLFLFGFCLVWEPPITSFDSILFLYFSLFIPIIDLFCLTKSKKNKKLALFLCMFLGWCGGHRFYLRKDDAIIHLLFFWTGIPTLIAIRDFFIILLCDIDSFATTQDERLNEILKENSFFVSKRIEIDSDSFIFFDDKNYKILFFYDNTFGVPNTKILQYKDILDFELCIDNNSRLQGRGLISTVGALCFGVTGAVVGTVAGDRKIIENAKSIIVNILINDIESPLISVSFLPFEVDKESSEYNKYLVLAKNFIAMLTYVQNRVKMAK